MTELGHDGGGAVPIDSEGQIGQLFVDEGLCSQETIREALDRQKQFGGYLGEILFSMGAVTGRDIAAVLARQHSFHHTSLLGDGQPTGYQTDADILSLMPYRFWWDNLIVPIGNHPDGTIILAAVNPNHTQAFAELRRELGGATFDIHVTGLRDVRDALIRRYSQLLNEQSSSTLRESRPHDSAHTTFFKRQALAIVGMVALVIWGMFQYPLATLIAVNTMVELGYLSLMSGKFGLILWSLARNNPGVETTAPPLVSRELPIYTVLVPAYKEARILPVLAKALSQIDYPADRLDVKLLLEEDDVETQQAALALRLPSFIDIVVVPKAKPQTKPRACNYGLAMARGEFVCIYDAEDIPDPGQLREAASVLTASPPWVACIQAKLAIYNRTTNLLTHWFAAEYMAWFDLLLPALHAGNLPIPLGGTSNHFRVSALREVGGWDPWNVTEDADLGIRLHKAGYRTKVINSSTYEEAPTEFGVWIKQRSRWIKGYMQTYLVHMRHPIALWRDLGTKGFWSFQALVGGTAIAFLLTPLYGAITTLWAITAYRPIASIFPSWIYNVALVNVFLGTFLFTYIQMLAPARRGAWDTARAAALSPIYWLMMSVSAWKALAQLITRPSYWEKTPHGAGSIVPESSLESVKNERIVSA